MNKLIGSRQPICMLLKILKFQTHQHFAWKAEQEQYVLETHLCNPFQSSLNIIYGELYRMKLDSKIRQNSPDLTHGSIDRSTI